MAGSRWWYRVLWLAAVASGVGCGASGGDAPPAGPGGGGAAGAGGRGGAAGAAGGAVLAQPSRGSTVAFSPDDSRVVAVNRDAGTVTVFAVTYEAGAPPKAEKVAEVAVGEEPWQVTMLPDGDSALVVCRKGQRLVKVAGLKGTPAKAGEVALGAEPTGVAVTPTGAEAWAANWVEGTVQVVDTASMAVERTVDLNATLAASGLLGPGVAPRPALAHPRSVAISNNGDDDETNEVVYVTEYFAQAKAPLAPDGSNADVNRVGVVYRIPLATGEPSIVELPPMADVGFADHDGGKAGCFPNQLQGVTVQGSYGYVVSVCASPKGPADVYSGPAFAACDGDAACPGQGAGSCAGPEGKRACATNCAQDADCGVNGGKCTDFTCEPNVADLKTMAASVVSVIDLLTLETVATVNLHREFDLFYDQLGLPDTAARRYPALANDVAFVPGTVQAYVTAGGSDAVYRVDFDPNYVAAAITSVGSPKQPFIPTAPAGVDASRVGRQPTGVDVGHRPRPTNDAPRYAVVANEATRNVAFVDLSTQALAGLEAGAPVVAASTAPPADPAEVEAAEGRYLFNVALGRWSLKGQGWASCATCHVDGLSDGVTWYRDRGPRQTSSLDASFAPGDPSYQRLFSWSAHLDEIADFENIARGTLGGVGAIVGRVDLDPSARINYVAFGHGGLNGSSAAAADPANPAGLAEPSALDDWEQIRAYARRVRSPRRPVTLDAAKVEAGGAVFAAAGCAGCHGGVNWTSSRRFYGPDASGALGPALRDPARASWAETARASGLPAAVWPATADGAQTMRYRGPNASSDQMVCALREVGTYGAAEPAAGAAELRKDMKSPAHGNAPEARGYNPPSLVAAAVGAPYFHAGGALTLEGALGGAFAAHREALAPGWLGAGAEGAAQVEALVQYLLSIDRDAPPPAEPALGPSGGPLCALPEP